MPHRRPAPPPPFPTASTTRPKSMPEAAVPAKPPQSSKKRPAPQPPKGARHSGALQASASPVPVPSNPPPPRPKKPDLEAHRCHIAMEDETIAEALSRAKLPSCRPPPADDESPDTLSVPQAGGRQRLSDMSMSTSSSDSLDYSPSPGFSFGLTSSPSQHLNHQDAVEDSSEDDENDDEDEEVDYGVGLETDLEMRLRQSSKAQRKRISVSLGGGSFILPRALKGRFQKVSGMLSSLVTPERRIIKKITELSQDRSSYFGSLVQDYISFVQENRGCHTSGIDFLQTLRQFMTQMKAYLCQSSELDPPLESLIPEDQIGKWTTCIMGLCVLTLWLAWARVLCFSHHPLLSFDFFESEVIILQYVFWKECTGILLSGESDKLVLHISLCHYWCWVTEVPACCVPLSYFYSLYFGICSQ